MKKPYQILFDFYLLIPCYNNLEGLIHSLQSVSYFPNKFSVLIIDDGSSNAIKKEDILNHVPADFSFEIFRLSENQGITKALNTGLEILKERNNSTYIARLDCGDICDPERFYRQINFLENNSNIDLVGSWCLFKDFSTGASYQYKTATEHSKISKGMHFKNMFIHPTVMWRTEAMNKSGIYPEQFPHAEDYGFFYEILNNGKGAVIPENLVTCQILSRGLSLHNRKEQLRSRIKVVKCYGKSNIYKISGVIKLMILMAIPSKMALQVKHLLYGT
jgi:glycosyltransferase involved in cell wall biosynthesis